MRMYFLTKMIKLLYIFSLLIIKVVSNYISTHLWSNKKKPVNKYMLLQTLILTACFLPVYGQDSLSCIQIDTDKNNINLYGQGTIKKHLAHSQKMYFRFNQTNVESGYANNRDELFVLNSFFIDSARVSLIDSIHIYAYSSPEGKESYNNKLASLRAKGMKEYLMEHYPLLEHCSINLSPQGENWQGLRELIACDTNFPEQEEVLMILDKVKEPDKRENLIKRFNGGTAYAYIKEHMLPLLRSAEVCTVYLPPLSGQSITGGCPNCRGGTLPPDATKLVYPGEFNSSTQQKDNATDLLEQSQRKTCLALKTNMLFDIALIPNIEIEVPVGKHWSLNGELMFPWWLFDNDKYCMQILSGGLEGRYWLGNRNKHDILTGHFAGLYAGGGKYDLQWKEKGYQGEFFIAAGISYGYAKRVSRNLHLEFNLGIGMLRTNYRHYHARDSYQTLLWQNNGRYTWFGPTKAKISLVWMLNRKVKGGTK